MGEARFKRSCRARRSFEGDGEGPRLVGDSAIDGAREDPAGRTKLYEEGEMGGLEGSVSVEPEGEAKSQQSPCRQITVRCLQLILSFLSLARSTTSQSLLPCLLAKGARLGGGARHHEPTQSPSIDSSDRESEGELGSD